jgi:Holliday junction resolvase RusA-like endonuclease
MDDTSITDEIPAEEYRRAERKVRAYIRRNYPAYKDRIHSISHSPRGKFVIAWIALTPYDLHKVYVPTGYRGKQ